VTYSCKSSLGLVVSLVFFFILALVAAIWIVIIVRLSYGPAWTV
jgi:hypothetical protein